MKAKKEWEVRQVKDQNKKIKTESMDVLEPCPTILIKLGSIAVHTEELLSYKGHEFDISVLKALLEDGEVKWWLAGMDKLALLPKKR